MTKICPEKIVRYYEERRPSLRPVRTCTKWSSRKQDSYDIRLGRMKPLYGFQVRWPCTSVNTTLPHVCFFNTLSQVFEEGGSVVVIRGRRGQINESFFQQEKQRRYPDHLRADRYHSYGTSRRLRSPLCRRTSLAPNIPHVRLERRGESRTHCSRYPA